MIYLLLAIAVVPCVLYFYFTRTFGYWKRRNVVSRKPVPFFGNHYETFIRREMPSQTYHEIYNEFPDEKVVGLYRMTTPALLIKDLDIIKHIMIKDFDSFIDRGVQFSNEGLGANLFHSDGDTWKVLRSKFTPMFTTGKLKNMLPLMVERGDHFMDFVKKETTMEPQQNVLRLLQSYFIATISACAFGLNIDNIENELESLDKIDKAIFTPNYALEIDMMFPGILRKIGSSVFPKYVTTFFNNLVTKVMEERNYKPTNRKDFMDLILELKQQGNVKGPKRNEDVKQNELEITNSVIAAQAFVFYAAGYETSSTTLTFLLYMLALHPKIKEKVHDEIDNVLAKYNGEISYDALQEMEYLEKVFNETLRMYPIVDPLQRVAEETYEVPGTNLVIEKGTLIILSVFGLHYDEKIWPNPHVFDPERFSPENVGNRHACSFLAFGTGPRNCIGMRFSKVSSRVCLVKLLSKYSVEPLENMPELKFNPYRFVVSPLGGITLRVVPRVT